MQEQEVRLKNLVGETLVGTVSRPDAGQQSYPVVVFVHGFYSDRDEWGMFSDLAVALADHGFAAYRFDLSGCGMSEGDYRQTTLTKIAEDVASVLEFVKQQPDTDVARLGVVGFSLGTAATLALRPRDVRCLVLIGAVAHPYETLQALFAEGFHPEGVSARVTSRGDRVEVGPQFWEDFRRYNLVVQMRKVALPTLFIHGGDDRVVPLAEPRALSDAAAEPKSFVVIPGAGHVVRDPRTVGAVLEWCERYLT